MEPRLAGLLGLAELPSRGPRGAVRRLAHASSSGSPRRRPVVMVFADLQWADQGLLDFVEDLLPWARTAPDLRGGARPGRSCSSAAPDWGERGAQRDPHQPGAARRRARCAQLLEGLVPGLPPAALRPIVERAEGIPLYAVETVRMLLDRELLVAGRTTDYQLRRRPGGAGRGRDAAGAHRVAPRRQPTGGPLAAARTHRSWGSQLHGRGAGRRRGREPAELDRPARPPGPSRSC